MTNQYADFAQSPPRQSGFGLIGLACLAGVMLGCVIGFFVGVASTNFGEEILDSLRAVWCLLRPQNEGADFQLFARAPLI